MFNVQYSEHMIVSSRVTSTSKLISKLDPGGSTGPDDISKEYAEFPEFATERLLILQSFCY